MLSSLRQTWLQHQFSKDSHLSSGGETWPGCTLFPSKTTISIQKNKKENWFTNQFSFFKH